MLPRVSEISSSVLANQYCTVMRLNERAACFLLRWTLLFLDWGAPILGDLPSVKRQSPWLQCQTGWFTALNMMYELWREAHAHTPTRVNLLKAFQRLAVSLFLFLPSAHQEGRRDLFVLIMGNWNTFEKGSNLYKAKFKVSIPSSA